MMGKQHAMMGGTAWAILSAPAPLGFGVVESTAVGLIAGTIMVRGAALLPDMDHVHASPTQALPPFTKWGVSKLIGKISGGHRNGTHGLIGIFTFTLLAWLASFATIEVDYFGQIQIGAALVSAFLFVLAFQTQGIKGASAWIIAIILGLVISVAAPNETWWLPLAVFVGAFVHSLGDFMTIAGINWIYPFVLKPSKAQQHIPVIGKIWMKNGRTAIPIFGVTGDHSFRMSAFMWVMGVYMFLVFAAAVMGIINMVQTGMNPLTDPIDMSNVKPIFDNVVNEFKSFVNG